MATATAHKRAPSAVNFDKELSDEAWQKIATLYQSGELKIPALAARFGISNQGVRFILEKFGLLRVKKRSAV